MNENIVVVAQRTNYRKKEKNRKVNVQLIFDNSYKVCSKKAPAIFYAQLLKTAMLTKEKSNFRSIQMLFKMLENR